ncbi:adenylate cyclase [Bacillus atrophaeus]|nr:CYTH domain-containing protein [Bacillus atrophaeus]MDQ0926462.1 adenylate cyclase [Bacillus atrophaeus]
MGVEIERKFLLPNFPKDKIKEERIQLISEKRISQNYLAVGSEEIRIRKTLDKLNNNREAYILTYKKGNTLERLEKEINLLKETYQQIQVKYKPINKIRSTFSFDNNLIYIDKYDDFNFCTIEIEFSSLEESANFSPPNWFGTEVTSNKKYKNQALWLSLNCIK